MCGDVSGFCYYRDKTRHVGRELNNSQSALAIQLALGLAGYTTSYMNDKMSVLKNASPYAWQPPHNKQYRAALLEKLVELH